MRFACRWLTALLAILMAGLSPGAAQSASRGTEIPRIAHLVNPAYPVKARRLGQEGRVVLELRIAKDGHLAAASVRYSSGYPLLDESALAAVPQWKFEPARTVKGEPVEAVVLVPVLFRLEENATPATAPASTPGFLVEY